MPTCSRGRFAADDGISLVEMLVAMVLLGVVLSASASTFISSFIAIGGNENRTRATALANEELENLRALPWQEVGFYSGDTFPAGMATAYPTVILAGGAPRPAVSRAPRPSQVVTGRGPAYTVTRTIEWVDNEQTSSSDPNVPSDQDYKRLAVNVAWTDGSGQPREVDVETIRAPTPSEQPASDFVLSLYDVRPDVVYLNEDGTIDSGGPHSEVPLQFSALTSAEANFLEVSFEEWDGTTTERALTTSGDGVTWSSAYPSGRFPNGEVVFTFKATRSWPVEQEVIGRRVVRFLKPLRFSSFTLTPERPTTCLAPDEVTPAIQVDVHVNGVVEEDTVSVWWVGQATAPAQTIDEIVDGTTYTAALAARPVGTTPEGTAFTATIPAGSYAGSGPVLVTATRQQTESESTDPPGQIVVTRTGVDPCE